MTKNTQLDEASRLALVRRYADGQMSTRDLGRAGHGRMIQILSDLCRLGLRMPLADMTGPNVESRQAGISRLDDVLRR